MPAGMRFRPVELPAAAEETRLFAGRLAAGPPLVTRMIKRTVYQLARSDLRTSLDLVPLGRSPVHGRLEESLERLRKEARASDPGKVGEMRPDARACLYRKTSAGDRKW